MHPTHHLGRLDSTFGDLEDPGDWLRRPSTLANRAVLSPFLLDFPCRNLTSPMLPPRGRPQTMSAFSQHLWPRLGSTPPPPMPPPISKASLSSRCFEHNHLASDSSVEGTSSAQALRLAARSCTIRAASSDDNGTLGLD